MGLRVQKLHIQHGFAPSAVAAGLKFADRKCLSIARSIATRRSRAS